LLTITMSSCREGSVRLQFFGIFEYQLISKGYCNIQSK
jgi:hypothetical protein